MRKFANIAAGFGLALSLLTSPADAMDGEREIYKFGTFWQNVAAEHVRPLLEGTVFVGWPDDVEVGGFADYVRIAWFGNGEWHMCNYADDGGKEPYFKRAYNGATMTNHRLGARYPLFGLKRPDGSMGYNWLRYNGDTGDLSFFQAHNGRVLEWWTGHLQTELPAVTWELCPEFPSAESLGAKVNYQQTSKQYRTLVAQDPGVRVRKPQYQAPEGIVEWLDLEGNVRPNSEVTR